MEQLNNLFDTTDGLRLISIPEDKDFFVAHRQKNNSGLIRAVEMVQTYLEFECFQQSQISKHQPARLWSHLIPCHHLVLKMILILGP